MVHNYAPVEEEVPVIQEEYNGPTADDLRREAEAFKTQWESEKQKMLAQAQASADDIVKKAEDAAFAEVKRQTDAAAVIKADAESEAENIIARAKSEAAQIVADAQAERDRLERDAHNIDLLQILLERGRKGEIPVGRGDHDPGGGGKLPGQGKVRRVQPPRVDQGVAPVQKGFVHSGEGERLQPEGLDLPAQLGEQAVRQPPGTGVRPHTGVDV